MEDWYAELFAKARVSSASKRAREVARLKEGATALILIHGDRSDADAAAQATCGMSPLNVRKDNGQRY